MIGRTLLHYEIVARIGAGGMGEVWRALDTRLNRDVAIKVLPADRGEGVQQQRFLREARAASALIHPNIITIHEINAAEGIDFIVMEFVRGETLASLIAQRKVTMAQGVGYALQICDALAMAHEVGIVHRDLKPGNIMITASGLVKVLDFGLAKRLPSGAQDSEETTDALTVAGMAVGTPAYMSPEQAVGDPVDARSDLFSFGVVLYQMFSGALPFQGTTSLSLLRQIVHQPAIPLRSLAPHVPESLAAIVDKCLTKEPEGRYASAAAVADDLRKVAAHPELLAQPVLWSPSRTHAQTGALPTTPSRPRRRVIFVAVAASIVALLGALAIFRPTMLPWTQPTGAAVADDAPTDASPTELTRRATELLRTFYRDDNIDKAIRDLELALQKQSPNAVAEARLSLAYWRKNAVSPDAFWQQQALVHAESAVRDDAQLAIAHVAHGAALALAGSADKASAAFERAMTLDPTNPELLWRLGDSAMARRDARAAEDWYRKSAEAAPKEWEPQFRRGTFYYRQGRYDEAVKSFEKVIELAPDQVRAYSSLAAAYHQLDRTDEAAAVLQRSLEIVPNDLTYSNLGTLLYFQGKYADALSAFERSVALGANTYLRWGNLADAARLTPGGQQKAHESYVRAIQLVRQRLAQNPNDADARSSLALYLIRDQQRQDALAEIDRALAGDTTIPAVFFKASIVTELAGQRARALDLLRRALEAGYQLREIRQEPDLVKLRTDPEYHRIAARFEK